MQQFDDKKLRFNTALGKIIQNLRKNGRNISISRLAREYELDRGNLSKLERGINGCHIITAWKICEAADVKFSDFAKSLESELGEKFKFMDE